MFIPCLSILVNYLRAVGRKVLWSSACVCLCALPARRFVSRSDTAVYILQHVFKMSAFGTYAMHAIHALSCA